MEIDDLIEFDKSKDKSNSSISNNKVQNYLKTHGRRISLTALISTLVVSIVALGIINFVSNKSDTTVTRTARGQLALTEAELKSVVANLNSVIYWAGPLENAKYTLDVTDAGAAYVRYLPNGEGASDTRKNYLLIATYQVDGAFEAIKTAGNEQDGIGLVNTDGAAIYYNKNSANNVYMAYPNQNFQIEVFDPTPGKALQLVNTAGLIRPVR